MHVCTCNHILKVCAHNILQTACGNFAKFITCVQVETTKYWYDFDVKRQGRDDTKYGQK